MRCNRCRLKFFSDDLSDIAEGERRSAILISDLMDYRIDNELISRFAESAEIIRSLFLIGTIWSESYIDPVIIFHDSHPLSA